MSPLADTAAFSSNTSGARHLQLFDSPVVWVIMFPSSYKSEIRNRYDTGWCDVPWQAQSPWSVVGLHFLWVSFPGKDIGTLIYHEQQTRTALRFPWIMEGSIEWRTLIPSPMPRIYNNSQSFVRKSNKVAYQVLIIDKLVVSLDICQRIFIVYPWTNQSAGMTSTRWTEGGVVKSTHRRKPSGE